MTGFAPDCLCAHHENLLMSDSEKTTKSMLYDPNERRIRSFVTRAGRLSDAQARALEQLGPKYMISYQRSH
jgi:tRNA (guanine-N7-)-methyltransferase